jgi:hypothetical protein
MQEPLTSQEYRRVRRRQLDTLVDNAELLNGMALRYSRRRARWHGLCRFLIKAVPITASIATTMAILSDKFVSLWRWFWSSALGGH